jgi:membrane protease YdiL (CAAX protease family)
MSRHTSGNLVMGEPQENEDGNLGNGTQLAAEASDLQGLHPAPTPIFPSRVQQIFFSPDGLRPGWRFLLYLVCFGLIGFVLRSLTQFGLHHLHRKPASIWLGLVGEAEAMTVALVAAFIMARLEKRTFGEYGLPKHCAFGRPFWIGAVWGMAGITTLLFLIHASGGFSFGQIVLHGARILKFAAFWGAVFLAVALFEEFFFRGYTQFTLTQGIGFWPAALLLSTAFGAVHLGNKGEALLGALAAGLIGLFFCLTLRRTGNLWFAVGFHASWDWGESYLFSVPDSGQISPGHLLSSSFHGSRWLTGGSVGPEGSVLVFVVVGLLWIAFARLYPEVKYPAQG